MAVKNIVALMALAIYLSSGVVHAAAVGMPEHVFRLGLAVGGSQISIDDPDGSTADEWSLQPFNLIYVNRINSGLRFWAEAYYQDTTLSASSENIGQNIQHYGTRFSLQKPVVLGQAWAPWFGVGIQLADVQFEDRHTKDKDGFLLQSFPNRSEFISSLLLNFASEWRIGRRWDAGLKLEQAIPLGEGVTSFSMSVLLLRLF